MLTIFGVGYSDHSLGAEYSGHSLWRECTVGTLLGGGGGRGHYLWGGVQGELSWGGGQGALSWGGMGGEHV